MARQHLELRVDTGWKNGNVWLFCEDVGLSGGNEGKNEQIFVFHV